MKKIDIRPGVSVLSVLSHLKYAPWFALAEFVDNSIQSFCKNRSKLESIHGKSFKLVIDITLDPGPPAKITVADNAGGISERDYSRAFRPAAIPPDRSGLGEFGMGMKSAACWFAQRWEVRTSALGENVAREIYFDIKKIVKNEINELGVVTSKCAANEHYTEIILNDITHLPKGRTLAKVKSHLGDIYRQFTRNNILRLRINGEQVEYQEPRVLSAPYFNNSQGKIIEWKKEIDLKLDDGLSATGFAAIREKASTSKAGFSLFRRDRVIQGSGDEHYRPLEIFKSSTSYPYQRIFGELHLEGFDVSHTKDGFRWDNNEEKLVKSLKQILDEDPLPLLKQAEGYRTSADPKKIEKSSKIAVERTAEALETYLPEALGETTNIMPSDTSASIPVEQPKLASKCLKIEFENTKWKLNIELTYGEPECSWLRLARRDEESGGKTRTIDIQLSMSHPFMVRFAQADSEDIEALLRVAAAIAVAEIVANDSGVRKSGTVRHIMNEILAIALSEA